MNKFNTTLAIVHKSPKVLLGLKKHGLGAGRWNGFGGKIKEGESPEEAAMRELEEECLISSTNLTKVGELHFKFQDEPLEILMHVYKVGDYSGEPQESDEMRPVWFHEHELPFDSMWSADIIWYPYFLVGRRFKGTVLFDTPENNNVIDHEIVEVEDFEAAE